MKRSSRILESLIILFVLFLLFQLYALKGAECSGNSLIENEAKIQINRPELPIGPVVGNCLNCNIIPANPIIFLELLQNAGSAMTSHWFRPELFEIERSGVVNNIGLNALLN